MPFASSGYARYVLAALTLVYTLSYLDQNLLLLLVEPIKSDLKLTDSEMGLVSGLAFGLFYATIGLPIARWADRGDRTTIAALAIGLWGLTVMSCLWVRSFGQLVLARMAAGIGGAGCLPPTYSLLGDYFPSARARTRAMTVFMLASSLAILVSFIVGGWVQARVGWRVAFFCAGAPGVAAAVLVKVTVKEPRKGRGGEVTVLAHPTLWATVLQFWRRRACRQVGCALAVLYVLMNGLGPWYAAFMIRSHGLSTAQVGLSLGLIFGVCGVAGTLLGGSLSARWFPEDERGQMRLSAIMTAALLPCGALFLLLPKTAGALGALVPFIVLLNFFLGPTFALLQRLVEPSVRATTLAIVMLMVNLLGMGIGPAAVGVLSDALRPHLGADSLRYAMLAVVSLSVWAAYHFWRAGTFVREELAR